MSDGTPVELYTLRNSRAVEARITTYGGIVTALKTPDKNGKFTDIVLGYDNLDGYVRNSPYFGAVIGRYGNRIAKARFTLDGHACTLAANNGANHLHGGNRGFDKVVWHVETAEVSEHGPQLRLRYLSKDGEEGYPGNLSVSTTYTVTSDSALQVEFEARTDKPTVCNLTHHSYFNLRGSGDVLGHLVHINADQYTPVDSELIPTGELRNVAGTPFDFRRPTAIGTRIHSDDEQIVLAGGYDHNWVLNKPAGQPGLAARVQEPTTGRVLEVFTNQPGMQFYTGNFLDGAITGKSGWTYQRRHGFCMEPQGFPDAPNHPAFPSTGLKPGEIYRHTIVYRFSAG